MQRSENKEKDREIEKKRTGRRTKMREGYREVEKEKKNREIDT